MRDDEEVVEFENVTGLAETVDAVKVNIDGKLYWIPKNQVSEDSEVYGEEHEGTLIISAWIATKKGLT